MAYVMLIKRTLNSPLLLRTIFLGLISFKAEIVDFISIHTYPVWEYKNIHEALRLHKENYLAVANMYPDIPVVITEAGWATNSNGRGIDANNVSENQEIYYQDLVSWTDNDGILCFVFEAFDEMERV
jgi:exo-beta-1,3-glucanase (GH17 family)